MLTHRSKKPYECAVDNCGKSYCDIRSLRRHFESQHLGLTMEDHMNYTGDERDPELMAAEAAAQASQQNLHAAAAAANSNQTQYINAMGAMGAANQSGINQMLQGTPPNPSSSPESSSSSSAALQFLAQAAQRAQTTLPLHSPSSPHSQSPIQQGNDNHQGGNNHIPVPQDVPGLYRMEEYANQSSSSFNSPTLQQQVIGQSGNGVLKFQQNSLNNPLLRPMLSGLTQGNTQSARDAMLGNTGSGHGGKGHKGSGNR